MRRVKVLIIWILLMFVGYSSFSDEVSIIDSLKNELAASSHDTTRIYLCAHISEKYQDTGIDIDSAKYYAKKAINIAGKNLAENAESDDFDETEKYYIKYEAKAYYIIGYCYLDEGNFNEAIPQFEAAIALCERIDSKEGIAENYTPLGIIQYAMGNYDGAIDYFQKGLDIFIEIEDSLSIASAYTSHHGRNQLGDTGRDPVRQDLAGHGGDHRRDQPGGPRLLLYSFSRGYFYLQHKEQLLNHI
ncbi:MAG: tetratricopeptide repeat protein, partial [Bacteroidales bacterium]